MTLFGPVATAANGGKGSPAFDLITGFAVLALTWFGRWKTEADARTQLWTRLGVTAICAVFIAFGVAELMH